MDKATLQRLYLDEKLSARQIADRLGESEAKIVYWIDKYGIPKRSISEAIYNRINGAVDPFDLKTDLNLDEEKLKTAGLMIWVTEGSLKNHDQIRATNSDPALIKIFVDFLLRVCRVKPEKIALRVVYYPNMVLTLDQVIHFWAKTTGLAANQVKPEIYQREHNYSAPSKYGTATVMVGNKKLRAELEVWLYELYKQLD